MFLEQGIEPVPCITPLLTPAVQPEEQAPAYFDAEVIQALKVVSNPVVMEVTNQNLVQFSDNVWDTPCTHLLDALMNFPAFLNELLSAGFPLHSELTTGRKEYEYEPASKYYTEGYSTYKRMAESPEEYVLFLRDPVVPPQNNLVERLARKYKRKAHQVMSFRSQNGSDWFCDGLSVTESIKNRGENVYEEVSARFNRRC